MTWLVERLVWTFVSWLGGWVVTRMHCGKVAEGIGVPLHLAPWHGVDAGLGHIVLDEVPLHPPPALEMYSVAVQHRYHTVYHVFGFLVY